MSATCGACGQPVTDHAYICRGCTGALTLDLQRIGGYRHPDGRWIVGALTDLIVAATHGAVIPGQGGGTGDDAADVHWPATTSAVREPANMAALQLHHEITADLTGWVRVLLDGSGIPCSHWTCTQGVRPVCRLQYLADRAYAIPAWWLERHVDSIRRREWAPAMLADLDRHVARAVRLVDLPPSLTVPCPWCAQRVAVDPDAVFARCRCGQWGTVDWWVEQVAPPLPAEPMTLAELPAWLRTRGYEVTPKQVEHWADRGQLPHLAGGGQGRARLFAAVTVLEVAEQSRARRVVPASVGRATPEGRHNASPVTP